MKKNWTMRIALVMVVLTIVTACFVSSTYAKYVTAGDAVDSARVAKFGVTVVGSASMFDTEYEKDDATFTESSLTVKSSTAKELVAPGTEGEMASFTLAGTPEVAVRVTYAITDVVLSDDWTVVVDDQGTEAFYCPLVFTVGDTVVCGLDYASADALKAALVAASITTTRDFAPNADLSANTDEVAVSWKWNFEADASYAPAYILQTDDFDTQLGDKAAAGGDYTLTIAITTTCTVTQID